VDLSDPTWQCYGVDSPATPPPVSEWEEWQRDDPLDFDGRACTPFSLAEVQAAVRAAGGGGLAHLQAHSYLPRSCLALRSSLPLFCPLPGEGMRMKSGLLKNTRKCDETRKVEKKLTSDIEIFVEIFGKVFDTDFLPIHFGGVF
jgi:hypothetical protein